MTLSKVFKAGLDDALAGGTPREEILNSMRGYVKDNPQFRGKLREVEEYLAARTHA